MKLRLNLCLVALVLAGLFWAVQGYGQLGSTVPNSRPEWLWIGVACMAAGCLMLALLNWPEERS